MISLRSLFSKAYPGFPGAIPDIPLLGIECDSRKVRKGFLFVAVRGVREDGNRFVPEALSRGAVAVAGEGEMGLPDGVPFVRLPDSREAVARLAAAFYGDPSKSIRIIGITGTNGKTTSSYLVEYLLAREGKKTGVVGTVSYRFGDTVIPAVETTPGPLRLQEVLAGMREAGCGFAAMEVSSHALHQKRIEGIEFETALFTNLTQDHLDYHGTMEAYFECKAGLFRGLAAGKTAVVNADDAWAGALKKQLRCKVLTFGIRGPADFRAENIRAESRRTIFELARSGRRAAVELPLIGLHNVGNSLGALAVLEALGLDAFRAAGSLGAFPGVPGRLEAVDRGQNFSVFIDFAHTPDGIENALSALGAVKKEKLFVVFGCGGDRDKEKRPKMARIAARFCDWIYVTSDNPRSEDPAVIAREVCAGFPEGYKNFTVILDRRKAVRQALLAARAGDVVLLAGKGHERSQVVGDRSFPYQEREEAERVLNGR